MSFTRILIANWDSDISGVKAHIYPQTRYCPPTLIFPPFLYLRSSLQHLTAHLRLNLTSPPAELKRLMRQQLHCSAAVQVAPDLSDV
jgi:hypothetical protein